MSQVVKKQQEQDAIVQAEWHKLYKTENRAWESAWPAAYKPAYAQFLAGVRALLNKEPRLLHCPDLPVRLIECAGLGLLPHWGPRGEAVIMYANSQKYSPQAALVVGYKGYEAAWYRDGIIKPGGLKVAERMPGDRWEYEETEEGTHFRWAPEHTKPRKYEDMILVFARAVLREGGCAIGIRMKDKCDAVMKWAQGRGQGGPAYGTWPLEMALKGAIMELKRILPFGENTERILEMEARHGENEPDEKDMGTAQRVDLSQARPIEIRATELPAQTHVPEVIEPAREREAVSAERAEARPGRIIDESAIPDPQPDTSAWTEELEALLKDWEASEEPIPDKAYKPLFDAHARLKGTELYGVIGRRLTALKKRGAKPAQRQPVEEG